MTERRITAIESEAGFRQAIDEVIPLAEKEIRVFSGDLTRMAPEEPERVAALESFLAGDRQRRLRIVVHDPEPMAKHMPRFVDLAVRRGHMIEVRQTPENLRSLADRFLLADDRHGVVRFHVDHARGKLVLFDPKELGPWQQRFQDLWLASTPCSPSTTLGL